MSGALAGVLQQATPAGAPVAPLASVAPDPGEVGGLLPATTLSGGGDPVPSRSLRPAVVALLPDSCESCAELIREVRRQASEFGLPVSLVGPPVQTGQLTALEQELGSYRLDVLTDPQDAFQSAYGHTVPTLIMVGDNGVVADVVRNPTSTVRLESVLAGLSPADRLASPTRLCRAPSLR